MSACNEAPIHSDGMLSWKSFFHTQIVVVLTIHHGCMDDSSTVTCRDEVGAYDGPGCRMLGAIDGAGEKRIVRATDEVRAREFIDHFDMMAKNFSHQILGEN